jgi:hypothetical protein
VTISRLNEKTTTFGEALTEGGIMEKCLGIAASRVTLKGVGVRDSLTIGFIVKQLMNSHDIWK